MPTKLVKAGSNVADLITSAGLLGNSLARVRLYTTSCNTYKFEAVAILTCSYYRTKKARMLLTLPLLNLSRGTDSMRC